MTSDQKDENERHAEMTRKNARMGLIVLAVVIGMAGLSFASVPLYDLFCRVTGFGGTTQVAGALPEEASDRVITVQFNSQTSRDLAWNFVPEQRAIDVQLGQRGLTAFTATNHLSEPSTGMAIYNVTPLKAGEYFHKIQCFCFDQQTLGPKEQAHMPVMFYVDPALEDDPSMDDVNTITLSYTFFKAETKELDSALEGFYNDENVAIQQDTN